MTDNELLETLQKLEIELHQENTRRDISRLAALLHPQFAEFGRSGRRYARNDVLSELPGDQGFPQIVSQDFKLEMLAQNVVLLTYLSAHKDASGKLHRFTLRSSLWLYTEQGWQMRFHQGTPTEGENW